MNAIDTEIPSPEEVVIKEEVIIDLESGGEELINEGN
jgi:hypothetical protein